MQPREVAGSATFLKTFETVYLRLPHTQGFSNNTHTESTHKNMKASIPHLVPVPVVAMYGIICRD